jgi:hypothetical protein
MLKVFLGSTSKDLALFRGKVLSELRRVADVVALAMEDFGAHEDTPKAFCLAQVRSADLYVGIIGHPRRCSATEPWLTRALLSGGPRPSTGRGCASRDETSLCSRVTRTPWSPDSIPSRSSTRSASPRRRGSSIRRRVRSHYERFAAELALRLAWREQPETRGPSRPRTSKPGT